jgi:restriction endonuclease S subunit
MAIENKPLGQLCSIITGAPISRVKKIRENDTPSQVQVLVPGAMRNGEVIKGELAIESVANVKDDFFTHEGDVIVKASTPYGCVYIDEAHSGLLTTSYSLILRPQNNQIIDMRYLSLFLNSPLSVRELERMSSGMTIQLVKKKDLAEMPIPIPSLNEQKRLGALHRQSQNIKKICQSIEEKNNLLIEGELARALSDVSFIGRN